MKCSNSSCNKDVDPEWDTGFIWITADGDLVCSQACLEAYEKERDHFYEVILPNDKLFKEWLIC